MFIYYLYSAAKPSNAAVLNSWMKLELNSNWQFF